MEAVVRGLIIYFFLVILFSIAGKRNLSSMNTFDFVLLLIISEAAQNALVGQNYSMTFSLILILTLVICELVMTRLKLRKPRIEDWMDGMPVLIVDRGRPLKERMERAMVDEEDVMSAARELHGLESMEQIKYAVLEAEGRISIIPHSNSASPRSEGHRDRSAS